jgi:hypothetical protein
VPEQTSQFAWQIAQAAVEACACVVEEVAPNEWDATCQHDRDHCDGSCWEIKAVRRALSNAARVIREGGA